MDSIPRKDEESDEGTNENTDDEVAVVVHCKQHDEVCHTELDHVQQSSDDLLRKAEAKAAGCRDGIGKKLHQRSRTRVAVGRALVHGIGPRRAAAGRIVFEPFG